MRNINLRSSKKPKQPVLINLQKTLTGYVFLEPEEPQKSPSKNKI